MPIVYDVTIESRSDNFRITWRDVENNSEISIFNDLQDSEKEILTKWEEPAYQMQIGQGLYRFLDGEGREAGCFENALTQSHKKGNTLQINLRTDRETADWPFELLARNNEFLLLRDLHLVRRISDRGILKTAETQKRPLRLLFMASSPGEFTSELNYNQEEEAILRITDQLPMDLEIEDSGSLSGLHRLLVRKYYDIVHLSGHANIDGKRRPFFYLENEEGDLSKVYPENLWDGALIENTPQLLFLSGCRTSESENEEENESATSFARRMVELYHIPVVLGWGRSVSDLQANLAGKTIYSELSRGRTIPEAVQRIRFELNQKFPDHTEPAWPMLRLNCDGSPLAGIVEIEQPKRPNPGHINHIYLGLNRMKVLREGFVGRRRQLQTTMRTLNSDVDKIGVLLLGTGGLGKSCLAGKIAERFNQHTIIFVKGTLNDKTLEAALREAFIESQDQDGLRILSKNTDMSERLADLCATSFKEKNYLLILDGLQQNQEPIIDGGPGPLTTEANSLLDALLYYLPFCGKMTHLIITSRYSFGLSRPDRDLVNERLQKVWLTPFDKDEVNRFSFSLKNLKNRESLFFEDWLLKISAGNPQLLTELDQIAEKIPVNQYERLAQEMEKVREDFMNRIGLYEAFCQCSDSLKRFLKRLTIYDGPISEYQMNYEADTIGIADWNQQIEKAMDLSMVEYDHAKKTYNLPPLFNEKLKIDIQEDKLQ